LALTYTDQGNWETAAPLFEKALELNDADAMVVTLWLDNLRAQTEPAVSVKAALQWRNARPTSAAAHFGLVREAHISGLERFVAPAEEAANAFFADALALHPRDANLWAIYARW
jgi:hypothetical protein